MSDAPVEGALNLRGRIESYNSGPSDRLIVDYGLEAFFMPEGTAKPVEDALRTGHRVQMEVAVAASGRSRIRRLIVDGRPVGG